MPLRSYALMKPAPSSARLSIGSSVRSNVGIAGAVLEVGDHDRDRIVLDRRRHGPRVTYHVPPSSAHARATRRRRHSCAASAGGRRQRHRRSRRADRARRTSSAVVWNRAGRIRLEAARDDRLRAPRESLGSIDRSGGGASLHPRCSSSIALAVGRRCAVRAACPEESARARRCRRADRPARPWPAPAPCSAIVPTMAPAIVGAGACRHVRQPPVAGAVAACSRRGRSPTDRAMPKSMMTALLALDHDVGRLQVAVHDAGLVRGDEARRRSARTSDSAAGTVELAFALEHASPGRRPRRTTS